MQFLTKTGRPLRYYICRAIHRTPLHNRTADIAGGMQTDDAEDGSYQRHFLNSMVVIAAIAFVTFSVFLERMPSASFVC